MATDLTLSGARSKAFSPEKSYGPETGCPTKLPVPPGAYLYTLLYCLVSSGHAGFSVLAGSPEEYDRYPVIPQY